MKGLTFWKCGGPDKHDWALGWWTGPDDDLLCIVPDIQDNFLADTLFLSPVCSNRILAVLAFVAKRFLLAVDGNLEWWCTVPSADSELVAYLMGELATRLAEEEDAQESS